MTDQEFSNYACKVLGGIGLTYILIIGLAYIVLPRTKSIKEVKDYNYELMMMYSDVHRAEKATN